MTSDCAGTATIEDESVAPNSGSEPTFTAVVYFHGMGSQKRYEEVSRLVDCLDHYAQPPRSDDSESTGKLRHIRAGLEPSRVEGRPDIGYVEVQHHHTVKGSHRRDRFRFYEAYWAPVAAGGVQQWEVVKWMVGRILNPVRSVLAPWRLRARLRLSYLYSYWSRLQQQGRKPYGHRDLIRLVDAYHDFEGPEAWREYPDGRFNDFVRFLEQRFGNASPCLPLARAWRRDYRKREAFNQTVLVTLGLALVLGALALLGLSYEILSLSSALLSDARLVPASWNLAEVLAPSWTNVATLAVITTGLLKITGFLRNFMGDVQLWTTYEETEEKHEKRREILEVGFEMLNHVLLDPACTRIVVVAHSLGTTVACDTLLQLGRYNCARPRTQRLPVEKLDQFITLASPIDKVHYFFESQAGRYHRYNRVKEAIRGDIGSPPFTRDRKPHIHWINFWDQADIVSGSLESPSDLGKRSIPVDNVQVSSLRFPAPAASHSAYFQHEPVVRVLYDAIFNRAWSFWHLPIVASRPSYQPLLLGPGRGLKTTPYYQFLMLALPWLILAYAVAKLSPITPWVARGFGWAAVAVAGFLGISYLLGGGKPPSGAGAG